MRKAALQLLGELLASNPFGPQLPEADFAASLAHFRARLQEMDPKPEEKPGAAAQWPEGQGIKPDPDPNIGCGARAPGDEECAADPGAAGTEEGEEEDAQVWGCCSPLEQPAAFHSAVSGCTDVRKTLPALDTCTQDTFFRQGSRIIHHIPNP